jgi:hypothetical protein
VTHKSGERAVQEAQFECVACHARLLLREAQIFPRCPECWGNTFRHSDELSIPISSSYEWLRIHDLRPY